MGQTRATRIQPIHALGIKHKPVKHYLLIDEEAAIASVIRGRTLPVVQSGTAKGANSNELLCDLSDLLDDAGHQKHLFNLSPLMERTPELATRASQDAVDLRQS